MRNIKLIVEYDGTDYVGWQRQSSSRFPERKSKIPYGTSKVQRKKIKDSLRDKQSSTKENQRFLTEQAKFKIKDLIGKDFVRQNSIQGTIEETIYKITGGKVKLIGSGRTDAGVHAKGQVANFKTETNLKLKELQNAFNAVLPQDILIRKIEEVNINFNARYDANSKCYQYSIINTRFCSPFYKRFYTHISYFLDFELMEKEAETLIGKHDFKAFQSKDKKERNSLREIYELSFDKKNDIITIRIEANGFLYKMVRNIVGTLIEIGRGKFPPGSMKKIHISKNRELSGPTAPPEGLCLKKVKYD